MRSASAAGAQEALEAMDLAAETGDAFSLILLDFMMPDTNGLELAREIRQRSAYAAAKLILLTSTLDTGSVSRAQDLAISTHLTKPLLQSALLDAILTAFGTPESVPKPEPEPLPDPNLHQQSFQSHALHILVAEDNPINRRLALRLLEKQGHTVTTVETGKQALARLEKETFDLVLMDIQMPEMDGLETTRAIRKKEAQTGAHLPIIAMTAHAMQRDRQRCIEAGMDNYISKPIKRDEFFKTIAELAVPPTDVQPAQTEQEIFSYEEALERVGGDEDLLKELLDLFLQESPTYLSHIRQALQQSDPEALAQAAHTLKGAAGNLGAKIIFETASRLEQNGHNENLTTAEDTTLVLEKEIEKFRDFLSKKQ